MIARHLDKELLDHFAKRKDIIVLLGARQVGKTTLLRRLFPEAQYLLVDNEPIRRILASYDIAAYRQIISPSAQIVVIDEIHLLSDPGRAAKIIYDQMPDVRLIITGSSALTIKNRATESLAGRKIDYRLYPLTVSEYLLQKGITSHLDFSVLSSYVKPQTFNPYDTEAILNNALVYGLYPHLVDEPADQPYLENLVESVIFRDILDLSLIENRQAALSLLRALALQIGSLINTHELSNLTGMSSKTVRRYLTIFEQSFIVFSVPPFTGRRRDEIGKMNKVYFWDVGLRNALIGSFQAVNLRMDAGHLWENFVVAEIAKANDYSHAGFAMRFWRTTQGSEVDLVLTRGDETIGLEIKTTAKRINRAFLTRFPQAKLFIITKSNFIASR